VEALKGLAMRMLETLGRAVVAGWVIGLVGGCATDSGSDAGPVLQRASQAMGAERLKSLRYSGDGTGWSYGQAYVPGAAWPKVTLHSFVRTIDYDAAAMRDEIVLSRAEPKGGGGYPVVGEQRSDQFVSGELAWNAGAAGPSAGPRYIAERIHQLWITPHGALKAALRNKATLERRASGVTALSFTEPGRFRATVFIGGDGLVERVESRFTDAVLGEASAVTTYSGYHDVGGIPFPSRVLQSIEGAPVLDLAVKQVEPNVAAGIAVPDAVRSATERVTADKVADGVWFIAGGSHNSVLVEMKDHLVLVESPLTDARAIAVIEQARQLAPGKPLRYVINSHNHFDHSGGLRAAVAEGATIVTQAGNKAYFERAFATPNTLSPDRLARSGKTASFVAVDDKHVMTDGSRTLEVLRITGNDHNDTFLMVWLPRERLLIEADAFTPGPLNAAPPSTPNPYNVNLVANLERLKLDVDRILPLHGRVVPVSELQAAVRTAPK
jgi:glyoxylase-like metal-dependent hydrolase (beta-lactamase superfamily II)